MSEQSASKLPPMQREVEKFANCSAEFVSTETVAVKWCEREISRSISTFKLHGHPVATLAFAWRKFSHVRGQERTPFIALNVEGVRTAEEALKFYLDRVP